MGVARRRDDFVSALDGYLTLVRERPGAVDEIVAAQTELAGAFSVLQDEVLETTSWSVPLGIDESEPEDGSRSGRTHVVAIELREIKPKRLRKLLTENLREQGVDKRDLSSMGIGDLIGETMHGMTSRFADIIEDSAELTVTFRDAGD